MSGACEGGQVFSTSQTVVRGSNPGVGRDYSKLGLTLQMSMSVVGYIEVDRVCVCVCELTRRLPTAGDTGCGSCGCREW